MERQILITYQLPLFWQKSTKKEAQFGISSDLESNVHFEISEFLPKGTEIYLLYPENQNNVRSDGYITIGIVFRQKEEFFEDVQLKTERLRSFFDALKNFSGCGNPDLDQNKVCKELVENGSSQLVRENWLFEKVLLP